MESTRSHGGSREQGQPVELVPGEVWSIGNFQVYTAAEMTEGLRLVGQAGDGQEVTFSLRAQEVKALGSLIQGHKEQIDQGIEGYGSVEGPMPPVHIKAPGAGPEPIPTNKSTLGDR
jgi:hypothetical protein